MPHNPLLDVLDPRNSPLFPQRDVAPAVLEDPNKELESLFGDLGDFTDFLGDLVTPADGTSGGRGRGRAAPAPTFGIGSLESTSPERLRDSMIGLYEQWTGAFPDRPSLEFVTNQALGGKALFDIRASVQATPEFRTRFKHMPAGMDVTEYDQALIQANAKALEIAGRPVNDVEIEKWFEGDGDAFFDSLVGSTAPPIVETGFITEEQFERQPVPQPTDLEIKQERQAERIDTLIESKRSVV